MEVSVETTQGLERRMSVTVPAERLEKAVDSELNRLKSRVKLDGFRAGKVPMSVIKQQYGTAAVQEAADKIIRESFGEAVMKEEINPAGMPNINADQMEVGKELKYTATFEVYPEIELQAFSELKVEKSKADIGDADVDKMVEKLREQHKTWNPVERAVQDGDQVNMNFKGMIDGKPFDRGSAENVPIVIGSKSMIDGFEDGLIGMKAGEEKTIDLKFPDEYHVENLKGKDAQFEVKVNSVSEPVLPELDGSFLHKFGITDKENRVEAFRKQVRDNMERECSQAVEQILKNQVMDKLYDQYKFDVPNALIDDEAQAMADQMKEQMQQQAGSKKQELEIPADVFKPQAERRVKLGLLIAEIVRDKGLESDPDLVRKHIEEMAGSYEKPEEVIDWYYKNPQMLEGVKGIVMEEQVVHKVMEEAEVAEETLDFEALIQKANQQTPPQ